GATWVIGTAEHDLDAGVVVTEGAQGPGHDLGCRCLGDADPHPHALAAGRLLGVGGHGLDFAQRPPRPPADRLAGRGQAPARAGGIGRAAAYWLARRGGGRILALEQYRLGHDRGASEDHSRIIRHSYHAAEYASLTRAAYQHVRDLEQETSLELVRITGGL